jgi:hypothetical protein
LKESKHFEEFDICHLGISVKYSLFGCFMDKFIYFVGSHSERGRNKFADVADLVSLPQNCK